MRVGRGRVPPLVFWKKVLSCGTMKVIKMMTSADTDERKKRRVDERLLHAVAQLLHRAEVFDEAAQDVRERAAGLPGHHEVDVQRRKDLRVRAQRLRKAAPVHQRLVQAGGQLPQSGLFEAFDKNAERLVECHAGGEQVGKLFREEQPLPVRQPHTPGCHRRDRREWHWRGPAGWLPAWRRRDG